MKTQKILMFFLVFIIAASVAYSFQTNSSNYDQNLIVSSGGDRVSSGSYKNYVATGVIGGVTESVTYKNWLGFFYTWLLGDDQPCTSASQCEGGYCCSSLCKSNSCPVDDGAPEGGGEGEGAAGGGGFFPKKKEFIISPNIIKTKLALGEESEKKLKIKNTGRDDLTISLTIDGVSEFIFLSESSFDVAVGEQKEIELKIVGTKVGSFVGSIIARSGNIKTTIPVILEVITEQVLFDVKLDIPADYAEVEPGDDLKAQITVISVGVSEKVDVFATYFIKDLSGNIIYKETETFAVEKQLSYPKSFKIHETTIPGSYVAIVEIIYADSFAVSSQLFRVVEKKAFIGMEIITKNTTLMILLTFILVIVISMLIYKLVSIKKRGRKSKKRKKNK